MLRCNGWVKSVRSSSFSSLRCVSTGLKENPPLSSEDAHTDKNPSTDRKAKSCLAKCCSDKALFAPVIEHKNIELIDKESTHSVISWWFGFSRHYLCWTLNPQLLHYAGSVWRCCGVVHLRLQTGQFPPDCRLGSCSHPCLHPLAHSPWPRCLFYPSYSATDVKGLHRLTRSGVDKRQVAWYSFGSMYKRVQLKSYQLLR